MPTIEEISSKARPKNDEIPQLLYDGVVDDAVRLLRNPDKSDNVLVSKSDISGYATALRKGVAAWHAGSRTHFPHFRELAQAVRTFAEPRTMVLAISKAKVESPAAAQQPEQDASGGNSNKKGHQNFVSTVIDEGKLCHTERMIRWAASLCINALECEMKDLEYVTISATKRPDIVEDEAESASNSKNVKSQRAVLSRREPIEAVSLRLQDEVKPEEKVKVDVKVLSGDCCRTIRAATTFVKGLVKAVAGLDCLYRKQYDGVIEISDEEETEPVVQPQPANMSKRRRAEFEKKRVEEQQKREDERLERKQSRENSLQNSCYDSMVSITSQFLVKLLEPLIEYQITPNEDCSLALYSCITALIEMSEFLSEFGFPPQQFLETIPVIGRALQVQIFATSNVSKLRLGFTTPLLELVTAMISNRQGSKKNLKNISGI